MQYLLQASLLPHPREVILYLFFDRTVRDAANKHLEVVNEAKRIKPTEGGSALGDIFVKTSLKPCL